MTGQSAKGSTRRASMFLTGAVVAAIWLSSPRAARAQGIDPTAVDAPVTMDDLQQATEPYGEWIDTPEYGSVWRPDQAVVGDDFEPYLTNGRWISAEEGWAFESAWPWGWATFHYGRWLWDARNTRWLWSPDLVWGPAWVQWRTVADSVAWLPLAPRTVTVDPRLYAALDRGRDPQLPAPRPVAISDPRIVPSAGGPLGAASAPAAQRPARAPAGVAAHHDRSSRRPVTPPRAAPGARQKPPAGH